MCVCVRAVPFERGLLCLADPVELGQKELPTLAPQHPDDAPPVAVAVTLQLSQGPGRIRGVCVFGGAFLLELMASLLMLTSH